ncbi:synaptonemal complex protein 1-like [Pyxicephalus adspersus]|uniref:synaptonemal complex protein 1-like n=1 Tax=Pyxicephalus adspersus TaxID=30357 RepID=UPI003B59FE04
MMEQEIPFKIFPLPRLSSSHVSAVKPVTIVENASFFQNLKSPLGIDNTKDFIHDNQDCFSHRVSPLPSFEKKNTENLSQLYSKLHEEAEKIKKWKSLIELEMKEKESKLQEKRKMLDAQRKAIKELQIENEKLRLNLHDVINENEELINQTNATRHVCNLLKNTCDRVTEKANIYENEIDETRQIYVDLNNNTERMIMAFEELRVQAENSRNEIYSQIKYEAQKRQEMQEEHGLELARINKQLLELTKEREDLVSKLSELKLQLCESGSKIEQLKEASKTHHSELEDYQNKTKEITQQLEEANILIRNTKDALNIKENQLHDAEAKLFEVAKEKEIKEKELNETQAQCALQLSDLQTEVKSLKELLVSEQAKLEEKVTELADAALEMHKMSVQIGKKGRSTRLCTHHRA